MPAAPAPIRLAQALGKVLRILAYLARAVKMLRECATEREMNAAKVGETSYIAIALRQAARAIETRDMLADGDFVGDWPDGDVLEDTGLY